MPYKTKRSYSPAEWEDEMCELQEQADILADHKDWLIKNYTETQALIRVESSYTKRAEMAKKEAFLKMVIDNLKALEEENK
jgi:hypothetical protein